MVELDEPMPDASRSFNPLVWAEQTKLAKRALIHPEPLSRARAKITFSCVAYFSERLQELLSPQG